MMFHIVVRERPPYYDWEWALYSGTRVIALSWLYKSKSGALRGAAKLAKALHVEIEVREEYS
jgi:uncharacterized protein YegP (UPF0339 family)